MFRDWKLVLLASAAVAPISGAASAQESHIPVDTESASRENDIVVTAQKREQRLLDVPVSVSVISAAQLQQNHVDRFADYFTRIPSAAISEVQAGQTRLILRGINTQGVGATVSTYVDEVPYGSATSLANGAFLTPDLDPADVARVEVLRGPQGTLYGANSLGGVVKYVTIAPEFDAVHASAEGNVESVDHGNTGYSGRAAINLPLSDKFAVRASGFYRQDPGFIDDPLYGKNINDGRVYGGRVSALFKPIDALTLRATAVFQNLNNNGTNEQDVDPVTLAPTLGRYRQSRISAQPNDIKYRIYNFTANVDLGFADLVSSTSWGNLDQDSVRDTSGVFTAALAPFFGTGTSKNRMSVSAASRRKFVCRPNSAKSLIGLSVVSTRASATKSIRSSMA
jgi:iron complex outermembrane receptor protein